MTPTFDEAIEEIMARGFKLGIAKLAPAERTIYVISNADFEINLGGASGYLYNSAGDNIDLLPFAFDTIGCFTLGSHARNLLNTIIASKCIPSDRQSRGELLQSRSPMLDQRMDDLEQAVQNQEEDYGQKLSDYYDNLIVKTGQTKR